MGYAYFTTRDISTCCMIFSLPLRQSPGHLSEGNLVPGMGCCVRQSILRMPRSWVLGIHRTPRSWAYIVHPGPGYTSYTQVLGIRCITQAASLGGSDNCGLNGYLRNYFVCSGGCCGQNRRCVASPPTKCGLGFVVLLTGVPGICFQHIPSCPSSLTTRRTRTASTRSILTY